MLAGRLGGSCWVALEAQGVGGVLGASEWEPGFEKDTGLCLHLQ